jgi:hypothetical protein
VPRKYKDKQGNVITEGSTIETVIEQPNELKAPAEIKLSQPKQSEKEIAKNLKGDK